MVKVTNAWWADEVIRAVVMDARIAERAAQLLGIEELYLLGDSLYWKAPLRSTEQGIIGWHQDRQYWDFSSTNDMITACINLYHADDRSGGLRFAAGSHRWGLVGGSLLSGEDNTGHHGRPPVPAGAEWIEVCPKLEPGQVTFHHALTFHGSGPNLSVEPRRSITVHMVGGAGRLLRPFSETGYGGISVGDAFRGPDFPRLFPPDPSSVNLRLIPAR